MFKNIIRGIGLMCLVFSQLQGQSELPDNFFTTKLDNGLEILVIEDSSVPLASLELTVRNGSYCESPEYNGLSHLYEHMFFKANKDYPSQEAFMEKIQEMGAVFNGTTSTDRVNYFITLSKDRMQDGLKFLNSAIRYPLFNEEEMRKENLVVDGEFERNESNPVFFLQDAMARNLWGEHYSRKNTIGDHEVIKTATPAKMKVIQEKYYYPNNTLLTVAGDVSHDDVFKMVGKIYGDWKASSFDPFEKWPIPEFSPLKGNSNFVVENPNVRVPYIMYGWHGPDTRNDIKATYAADIFNTVLMLKTSKLQKDLVDSGLALGLQIFYQTNKYTGPINIIMVPNPTKVNEAIAKLEEHINMWDNDDYFTDEQLATAKEQMAIQDAFGKESTSDYLHTVTFWWATANFDYYVNYVKNMEKVDRKDIKKYVNTYIKGKPYVKGVLTTADMRSKLNLDKLFPLSK